MSTRYGRIQVRHDSAEHLVTHNPVLLEGEWGFETDTGKAKIGVGKTWIETDYFSGHQDELTAQFEEMLAAEKEDRQKADAAIENHIARVKEDCEQADQSLAEHNDETNQRLAGEIDDRITGDKNLQVQVARLAEEFDKLLAGIEDVDTEQLEIILQSAARLSDLIALDEKLEKEKFYRIEGDAELEAGQERQDDEIERIELESKARDLALELEILYLATHGSACNASRSNTMAPDGPPFVNGKNFNVNGNVVHITNNTFEEIAAKVGDTLRFTGRSIPDGWSSVITDVGERYQPPSGWYARDITVEDIVPPDIADSPAGATFDIASCEPSGFVKTEGDTMTGDLIVNAEVHADVVETLVVDSGENSNLLLKHDGNTKVYVGSSQVTIQNPLKLNTEGTDDGHAVTKKYIDDQTDAFVLDQQRQDDELTAEMQARAQRDLLHDAQIDTIEYKLESLIGVTFRGTYEFKYDQSCEDKYRECMANCANDARCESDCLRALSECEENSVDPGFFEAIDPDGKFDNLQEIIISKNDKSNLEIDWAGVLDKDDYLEVDHVKQGQLDKTNYGLYRILEEPETHINSKDDVVYVMKLQFLQGDGVLNEREPYEIRGITAAEGVNPEELGDFLTKDEANSLYALKTHAHKGEDITSGKVSINRLPTGTSSSTVAVGNHGHSGYAGSGHNHNGTYVKGSFTITKSNGNYYIS